MGLIIKLIVLVVVLVVVVVVAAGLYLAVLAGVQIPVASGLFGAEGKPPSQEVVARAQTVERKIDVAVSDKSAFFLELTDEELTALLLSKLDPEAQVRDAAVAIKPDVINVSGHLNGRPAAPFSGAVTLTLTGGEVEIELTKVSLGVLPVPGAVRQELQPLIDQVLDLNEALRTAGATQIQQVELQQGKVTIVGVQQGGKTVSDLTKDTFRQAFQGGGGRAAAVPPGADVVPAGSAGLNKPGPELYLALGDSLAANVGVSQPQQGYVSRFHSYLEKKTGRSLGLQNLGVSGESSISIVKAQLPRALDEMNRRKNDGDPNTKVSVLTLDLGANDLLAHLGSSDCQQEPRGAACQARINAALEGFTDNFDDIVSALSSSLEPGAEFYIMTMYNPFDLGIGIPFEAFSSEIIERLNAIIRDGAAEAGARLADPFELTRGNAGAWTNILDGDIHPKAEGYQALAFSLAQARER